MPFRGDGRLRVVRGQTPSRFRRVVTGNVRRGGWWGLSPCPRVGTKGFRGSDGRGPGHGSDRDGGGDVRGGAEVWDLLGGPEKSRREVGVEKRSLLLLRLLQRSFP